jgi:hypothetical protein
MKVGFYLRNLLLYYAYYTEIHKCVCFWYFQEHNVPVLSLHQYCKSGSVRSASRACLSGSGAGSVSVSTNSKAILFFPESLNILSKILKNMTLTRIQYRTYRLALLLKKVKKWLLNSYKQKFGSGSQGADPDPPSTRGKAGRNHLKKEINPLLPTGIGERYSQTKSYLGHAALLRRCELPQSTKLRN